MRSRATINSRKDNLRAAPEHIRSRRNFHAYARVCRVCISDVCYDSLSRGRTFADLFVSETGTVIESRTVNYIIKNEFFSLSIAKNFEHIECKRIEQY